MPQFHHASEVAHLLQVKLLDAAVTALCLKHCNALQVKLLDAAMPPLPRRRPTLRSPVDGHAGASAADAAVVTGKAANQGDSIHTGGDGGGGSGQQDGGADGQQGSGKQEAVGWDADFGAQRISPAVEALTMLARNNPKNR